MSLKGVVGALRLEVRDAPIAANVIRTQTAGLDLSRTKYAALPAFGKKLDKAIARLASTSGQLTLWTVTRDEAKAASTFLLLFSRPDIPSYFGSNVKVLDALNDVAMDILLVSTVKRGRRSLSSEEVERRLQSTLADMSESGLPDERWIRRLRSKKVADEAFWQRAMASYRRRPLSSVERALLAPRQTTTGN